MCGRCAGILSRVEASHPKQLTSFMRATACTAEAIQATTPAGIPPANWITDCAACADHADLPHPLDLGRPVGNEAVLAVERLCTRVRVGHPQRHRLLQIDDRLQQRRPSTRTVIGRIHIKGVVARTVAVVLHGFSALSRP